MKCQHFGQSCLYSSGIFQLYTMGRRLFVVALPPLNDHRPGRFAFNHLGIVNQRLDAGDNASHDGKMIDLGFSTISGAVVAGFFSTSNTSAAAVLHCEGGIEQRQTKVYHDYMAIYIYMYVCIYVYTHVYG